MKTFASMPSGLVGMVSNQLLLASCLAGTMAVAQNQAAHPASSNRPAVRSVPPPPKPSPPARQTQTMPNQRTVRQSVVGPQVMPPRVPPPQYRQELQNRIPQNTALPFGRQTVPPPAVASQRPSVRTSFASPSPSFRSFTPPPVGARDYHVSRGDVRMRATSGQVMDLRDARTGTAIHYNLAGGRRIETMQASGRTVYEKGRPSFVGTTFNLRGQQVERRTFYIQGQSYDRFYYRYTYGSDTFDVYTPRQYYSSGFYGWLSKPWMLTAPIRWSVDSKPWYGQYKSYVGFNGGYSTASLWLTDYLLYSALDSGYRAQLEINTASGGAYSGPPVSPETKNQISNEVSNQINFEEAQAKRNGQQQAYSSGYESVISELSDGHPHTLIAFREFDVTDNLNRECALTEGDVVGFSGPVQRDTGIVKAAVLSSKGGRDCSRASVVNLNLSDLQEMSNGFRENVDNGFVALQSGDGTQTISSGLPSLPQEASLKPAVAGGFQELPPSPPDASKLIAANTKDVDSTELDLMEEVGLRKQ
jgi:hypothetical protein